MHEITQECLAGNRQHADQHKGTAQLLDCPMDQLCCSCQEAPDAKANFPTVAHLHQLVGYARVVLLASWCSACT